MDIRAYLASGVPRREDLDRFLDPGKVSFAKFDPETGYRLSDIFYRDGMDGCYTINTYLPNDARRMIHYSEWPCRINTYGDSFAQCHQVSDGETWQEILAAHFGEPIRNFGVGGFGVYQAYRRMRRIEPGPDGAEYVILNVYYDDHYRNLDIMRWLRLSTSFHETARRTEWVMFHSNPSAYVRLDRATRKFVEHENPFPTPESLYQLCDAEFVYEAFRHDEVTHLACLQRGGTVEDTESLEELAELLGVPVDFRTRESSQESAQRLFTEYALRSTMFVVDLAAELTRTHGKKLMILLSYGSPPVVRALKGEGRFDQPLVDYLDRSGLPCVDALNLHVEDARAFRLSPEQYCKRYYIGHYSPVGNHFFAFAIKDALVRWLDPKPVTYRESDQLYTAVAAMLA